MSNQNEKLSKLLSPVSDANYHFHEKYLFSRNLWLAAGCALGVLAVKGYNSWRQHRAEEVRAQPDQEIERIYIGSPPIDKAPDSNAA